MPDFSPSFLVPADSLARRAVLLALFGVAVAGCGTHPTTSATPPAVEPSMTTITVAAPVQEKAIVMRAQAVMSERLRALGIGTFTAAAGDHLTFTMAIPASVDPGDVDAVLNQRGDVLWLAWSDAPWPAEGEPVREGVQPLFDGADITSASVQAGDQGAPGGVLVRLNPAASEALYIYTSSHVGEPALPLAMDGTILLSPAIQEPIDGGEVVISFGLDGPISPEALAAILSSGPLPAAWTGN